jgi:excisionase family DNA binding protein
MTIQAQTGPAADPRYLTVAEAADLARCSTKTIRRAIALGRLRAHKPTARVLISQQDLQAWVESQAVAPVRLPRPERPRALRGQAASVERLRALEREAG